MTSATHPLSDGAASGSDGRTIEIEGSPVYNVDDWSDVIDEIESAGHPRPESVDEQGQLKNSRLPALDLPGFGQRDPNCGEYIPEAMRYCVECGDVKQNQHNCLRYDCPDHAPYAIRRRAAGSSEGSGIAPKLGALIRTLGAYNSDSFNYHHLALMPDREFLFESDQPLERGKQICRAVMDKLGIQGIVVYHPWAGDHEDPDEDDMGLWRTRLFHDRDWRGDVRDELELRPHFHIIGVAPYLDISNEQTGWEDVHNETGWVLKRFLKGDGSNRSIEDELDMATKLTYALSHAGVYSTKDQRRLAAWFKGPDVNKPAVYESVKIELANKVHASAEDTLGIPAPSFKCEEDVPARVHLNRELDRELQDFTRASEARQDAGGPLAVEPIGGFGGPNVDPSIKTGAPVYDGDSSSSTSSSTSLPSSSVDLDGGESSSSWSRSAPTVSAGGDGPDEVRHDPDGLERCGGYVRHISTAGEYLLSGEWRERALYDDDLESAYRSYVDVMTSKRLDPLEGEPLIPEETDPPPDEPPAD